MSAESPLEIHDLTVAYHRKPVLWGVDLTVPAGQLIGIIGLISWPSKTRAVERTYDFALRKQAK